MKALALMLILGSFAAQAQDDSVKDLQQQLRLRDNTILELLERLEAVERRLGLSKSELEDTETQQSKVETDRSSPGAVIVSRAETERALERSLTRDGALLLSSGTLELEPGYSYSRREQDSPGFVTVDSRILASENEQTRINQAASLALRFGLPWDAQLEIAFPYQRNKVETVTSIGFSPTQKSTQIDEGSGDWRIGIAKTLHRERLNTPSIIGRLSYDSDSGDADGFEETSASFIFSKRQDPLNFVGALAYQETRAAAGLKPGSIVSVNLGAYIAVSPETSLSFIVSSARQKETEVSGDSVEGSGRDFASLIIGGSTLLAPGTLLHFSVGTGLTDGSDDFSFQFSLPFRFDG